MNILMIAAENDSLPGGKVGGIGDVLRDIPPALAAAGQQVHVVTPGYQKFSTLPGAEHIGNLKVFFASRVERVDIFSVPARQPREGVNLWILEHPLFAAGGAGNIYCDDPPERPFATDATKFALFSAAVGTAILENVFGELQQLHLHDWHASMLAVLRAFDPVYKGLKKIPSVYSIHNLALQGVRPLGGDDSSLAAWFPNLDYQVERINDPAAPHCINLMRAGINLSDKIHAVSPSYAREILLPSDKQAGFFGGEGLHQDLCRAAEEGRLYGILNGCEYPEKTGQNESFQTLLEHCENEILRWIGSRDVVDSEHFIASRRLAQWLKTPASQDKFLLTSVGRLTDQKVLLLQQVLSDGRSALEHCLDQLGDTGLLIMIGSGAHELERFITRIAGSYNNILFLKGYSDALAQSLYLSGDLFLMPSSFEPCGISQMLAMRAGQPCLVHAVGGLNDTVQDGKNGFVFQGEGLEGQALAMIDGLKQALEVYRNRPKQWQKIATAAGQARFLWKHAAQKYIEQLYH